MTQTSYPFDAQDTTEAQYSQLFKRLTFTGVSGTPAGTELKASADSSGMNVKVPAGFAIVRGHAYNNDAQVTLTIGASASNPRRDLVVLRLDPSTNSIVLAVKAGTAAATPSDPSLTQTEEGTFELPIARVTVPANAVTISASDVTDLRTFVGAQFGRWVSSLRPSAPAIGTAGFNTSTLRPEVHNGSAWKGLAFEGEAVTASQLSSGEQALLNAGKVNGSKVSVQATAPTSPSLNDLWFWGE